VAARSRISRTKAYALGLTGMFLNLTGREAQGIVEPGDEARAVKAALIVGLSGLRDEAKREVGIRELFDTSKIYDGPYMENAPDLIVGYNAGYRVSWDCATGVIAGEVFEDNLKAWSGDHGIDPRLVPGVFFCNRDIDATDPALIDIAPTALRLFGIEPPAHMDGKPLFRAGSTGKSHAPASDAAAAGRTPYSASTPPASGPEASEPAASRPAGSTPAAPKPSASKSKPRDSQRGRR
jgi:predicted AlkP superfamily phosphohydrolase/phosphomutase